MALVTCATLAAAIASATPGASITLQPGIRCENVVISNRDWSAKPVTIMADKATVAGLRIQNSKGLHWKGGTLVAAGGMTGRGPQGYAANVRNSTGIRIENVLFTDAVRGIVVAGSQQIELVNNNFQDLRMDGINLASTSDSLVDGNRFSGFQPIPTTCALPNGTEVRRLSRRDCQGKGGKWTDGDHSDAIQLWNQPRNIRIVNNDIQGHAHGIALLGPPGDTGYNITAENNRIRVSTPHGITLEDCTDCRIVGNDLAAAPGSDRRPIVRNARSSGAVCGNQVANAPGGDRSTARCRN